MTFEKQIKEVHDEVVALRKELKEIKQQLIKGLIDGNYARRNDF